MNKELENKINNIDEFILKLHEMILQLGYKNKDYKDLLIAYAKDYQQVIEKLLDIELTIKKLHQRIDQELDKNLEK